MNHIDMYESLIVDHTINYDIRAIIRNLHTMKMDEMLQARELVNSFVAKKHNDYMVIVVNERNKAQI